MPRRQNEKVDRRYAAQFLGFVVLLAGLFVLFPTVRTAYLWWKSEDYVRTEVEALEEPSRHGWMRVRVASTAEDTLVKASSFDERFESEGVGRRALPMKGRRLAVWYNPDARWVLGITLFDQRVVSASRNPSLPTAPAVTGHAVVTTALFLAGAFLATRPYR